MVYKIYCLIYMVWIAELLELFHSTI